MLNIIYTIIIYPLFQIIEFVYQVAYKVFEDSGLSIICVSFAVTLLCLPLYIVAEKWQDKERKTMRRMKPGIEKIKSVFKGDEQYMILSTYYRQNHYHPIYGLRNSFGILIQIPFFIAAYLFLSHLETLKGASFFFIRDLNVPDGLLTINGKMRVNILPILMTVINCAAAAIYTRNLYTKDRIQVYGTAAVFLVLLYNSPAGLVLYWTMNNILSLIKNIFFLFRKPLVILYIILCALVFSADIFLLFFHHGDLYKRILLIIISLVIPLIPFIIKFCSFIFGSLLNSLATDNHSRNILFIQSMVLICLLTGFVIPSSVIGSSPQEFSYIESVSSPFSFLFNTLLQAVGFSIFWPICIYFLFGKKIKSILTLVAVFLCYCTLINTFIFSGEYGEFTAVLNFVNDGTLIPSLRIAIINLFSMVLVILIAAFLVSHRNRKIIASVSLIIIFALAGISIVNSINIRREFIRYTEIRNVSGEKEVTSVKPIFHLSKEGKNVIVLMLDRAINSFVPEIFSESPELYEQFSGFKYYPNTISFNGFTLMGAPPLFGGYEYTPEEINKRSSDALVKKHNEALLLMPRIFSENNFEVTITDPPWANYSWMPDIRIYADYPEITVQNTLRTYINAWLSKNNFSSLQLKSQLLKRNFIWFSWFKCVPLVLRTALYNSGKWWNTNASAIGLGLIFNNYAVLDLLPDLTDANNLGKNTFLLMQNELTHEPAFLQAPDYVPAPLVTDRGKTKYADIINYPANAAALKRLGTWFAFLKQNGLYDNTRIIIVADHGANIDAGVFSDSKNIPFNRETYHPLLLMKDFNDDFPLKTDSTFMTNADVPTLAFEEIIQNPVNPFTGKPVNDSPKENPQHITTSDKWMPNEHYGNTFKIKSDEWYSVKDDIFDANNWQKVNH